MRLLDLYCGAGGSAVGYYRAGFTDIVGVDTKPQRSYPFKFVQSDAIEYVLAHGIEFDAVHASPPCQRYTIANRVHAQRGRNHPDLIHATRSALVRMGIPWVMENVVGAPLIQPIRLCGVMFGLKVFRHRLFESNVSLAEPSHPNHNGSTGAHRGYSTLQTSRNGFICVAGHNFKRDEAAHAMGIDWMQARWELVEAIPPAYTEWIGRQVAARLNIGNRRIRWMSAGV